MLLSHNLPLKFAFNDRSEQGFADFINLLNSLDSCFGRFTRRRHLTNAYEDRISTHCYSWLCVLFSMFDVLWSRKIVFIALVVNIFYGLAFFSLMFRGGEEAVHERSIYRKNLFEIYWLFHLRWHSFSMRFYFSRENWMFFFTRAGITNILF